MVGVDAPPMDCSFRFVDWAALESVAHAKPVIPGLLNEGESGSLIAQAGVGKSLLTLEVAVALSLGLPVLGEPANAPINVMYIDLENSEAELADRLRSMGIAPHLLNDRLSYASFPDLPPLNTVEGGRVLALAAEAFNPQLIVLDTISRLIGGNEDSAETWQSFYRYAMVPLKRQNRTVLRLDHQGHDSSKGARGSSAKRDDVDVAWIMQNKNNNITLTCNKGRGLGHPEKIELRRHSDPLRHLPHVSRSKEQDCREALDRLEVPLSATRDDAGDILRSHGYQFRNEVVGAAVKARRPSPSHGTADPRDG